MFIHLPPPKFEELKCVTTSKGRWYTTPSGEKLASVTTILGHKPKPYLEECRQSLGPKKADKETERCSIRGDAVHLMSEHYLNNEVDFTKTHKTEHVQLFNQLKIRLNNINNIRAQEIPLFSEELRIAGRADCVGMFGGTLAIIDFKTSNNNKDDKMINDYKVQCCMYSLMWLEMFGEFIEDYVILIAVEKGAISQVFKGKVKDHITEATQRIAEFYKKP